jgi:ElaB/YqjD/DUF883 family membrane-anchored ribosome-binding protein
MRKTETTQTLTGGLESTGQDAEEMMDGTSEAGEKMAELRGRLNAALEAAKTTALRLEEKTIEAAKATDRCIRDHPYQTLGLAFGLGLLFGVLITRRGR